MNLIDSRMAMAGPIDTPSINSPDDEVQNESNMELVDINSHTNGDWHDQVKSASRLLLLAMERLGLEDRHENLASFSPLYKKVSSAVFPPFKASLSYIQGQMEPGHANSAFTGTVAEIEDDFASLENEQQASTSILSMLATASAFAGSTSLKAIGRILHEHNSGREDDTNDELYSSEFNGRSSYRTSANTRGDKQFEAAPISRNGSQNDSMRHKSTLGPMGQTTHRSMRKPPTSATLSSGKTEETKLLYRSEIMAKAFSNDEYRAPPEILRSTWENSVMANHHLYSRDQGLWQDISRYDDFGGCSPEKLDILKYHIALKLRETFDFDDENFLYDHFDCWLVKDVLLQGHMYLTRDAVCFYSLVPGKSPTAELTDPELTLHAGAVGHKLAHYGDAYFSSVYTNRFWAVLKPQTLSIYTSPTKLYFPVRTIDLRQAISCEIDESTVATNTQDSAIHSPHLSQSLSDPSLSQSNTEMSSMIEEDTREENVQAGVWFKIICTDKTYRFHTSSIYSARHWYNSISKAIFLIHNTNHQHEVIMRIPIYAIIDYKKNDVLSEAEAVEAPEQPEEDSPIAFSIRFDVPTNSDDSRMHKLKPKTKRSRGEAIHESAHFIVFSRGQKLGSTFEQVMEENVLRGSTKNTALRKKTKKFFREDRANSVSSLTKSSQYVVTTVRPDLPSSQSVIEKIIQFNTRIMHAREKELAKVADEQSSSSLFRENDNDSKLFGYVPTFKGMKDKLLPKSMNNRSVPEDNVSDVLYEDFDGTEDFLFPDFDLPLQLPRPFSLRMLQNLNIQMVRKTRTFDDIASQNGALSEVSRVKKAKENAFMRDSRAEENEGDTDTDSHTAYSEPESNEYTSSKMGSKSGKLQSIKNSLRSISSISGVWSANRHSDRRVTHDRYYVGNNRVKIKALNNFRNHFSLGSESHLVSTYHAHLKRTLPVFGRLYVGKEQLCFRSKIPGVSTKMVLPLRDIQSCKKSVCSYRCAGLILRIRGLDDLQFSFGNRDARNHCQRMILKLLRREEHFNPDCEFQQDNDSSSSINIDESDKQTKRTDELAMTRVHAARLSYLEDKISYATGIDMPLILEENPFTTTDIKLARFYKITLLTIGSRGDVQPYIALGKALLKEGHKVTIATHQEFREWIEKHGIQFKEVAGNPAELMSLMVTHGSMSVGFLKEAKAKFRGWIDELLESSWKACQGAELLIESPSAMAGLHIAEALNIPYMRAFTMPWTRTKAYPHAFLVPDQNRGGSYNFLTHVMFENVFWKGISGQVNRWREETLNLPGTSLVKMQQSRVPFLYNVSPAMFPPAVDFPDWVKVTGYWFLDEGSDEYEPPRDLVSFLETAKSNNEKVVYIGFGSIVVSNAKALTKTIVEAVVDSGVKCILNKGWSDRLTKKDNTQPEVELPSQVYDAGMIPHDWLFTRIDAAVHHGGSGTTGATLRAGIPTIVKPFFGDQFFFASRIEDLGVGIALKQLNKKSFTKALKQIASDEKFATKATEIAREMSHERGVLSAMEAIYTELAYSKSLISGIRSDSEQRKNSEAKSEADTTVVDEDSELTDMANGQSSDEVEKTSDGNDESMSEALHIAAELNSHGS